MQIHVEDNLYILSEEKQFTIAEKRIRPNKDKKEPEEYFYNIGYYGSLKGVCNALITRKIKKSTATTLKELLVELERIKIEVESKVCI